MPGLVGFTTSIVATCKPKDVLAAMQDSLTHRSYHVCDEHFEDPYMCASRVRLDTVLDGPQPFRSGGIFVWFDGELYNKDIFKVRGLSDAQLVLEQQRSGTLARFLQKADGIFAAVIYDQTTKSITIINDRYGLRYLYIFRSPVGYAWASELKAFRCLPSQSLTIDSEAASLFFSKGFLSDNRTWFRDVELLAPGTMFTIRADTGTTSALSYCHWNTSAVWTEKHDISELARELGERFKHAVARRCNAGESIGIGLSGGLDSRAIFAAMPAHCEPLQTFTFGITGSKDLRIAQKVTALRPSNHHAYALPTDNWFEDRADAVWRSDGQFNLLHMHGIEHAGPIRGNFKVSLNGFQSDALLGASFTTSDGCEKPRYPDRDRRFIAMGLVLASQDIICRLPFFDNDFMALTLSIPLKDRRNSFIFHKMLLITFPEYYQDIPWQKTNKPISHNRLIDKTLMYPEKCAERLAAKLKIRMRNDSFADYSSWIRQSPAREFFKGLLTDTRARIFEFVDPSIIRRYFERHMHGWNYDELIGRYATFEIWLRRFYGT
jgi:asparagine synthase (glutamine-hydrolysing)